MTKRILSIDRALYEVDRETRTYRYVGRNPEWRKVQASGNERDKKSIDGYTRIFPDGRKKKFVYDK